MLKLAGILCCVLAIGSLVVAEISGGSTDALGDVILSRLDLARLSQLRVELRKLEPARRCSILEQELNAMFSGKIASQGPHGLFGPLSAYLSQRQLPFQNKQPVLEDLQMCIDLADSSAGSSNGLPPNPENQPPVQREVIRSPPMAQPLHAGLINPMENLANEFNGVKNRVKDFGQDLYNKVTPMVPTYGQTHNEGVAPPGHQEQAGFTGNMGRIGKAIQNIVEDAADGRIDGIKGHLNQYNPYAQHPQASHQDESHYDANQEAYLQEQQYEAERRLNEQIEDEMGGSADHHHHHEEHSYGSHQGPASYINSAVDEMHHQQNLNDEAKRVIEDQMRHIEDAVEDAADGRLDGINGHMPSYNEEYTHHQGMHHQDAIPPNMPYYNPHNEGVQQHHHQHEQAHSQGHFSGPPAAPIDPRNLPSQREMDHARGKVESRIDDLQDKLRNVVADAADGRLDGFIQRRPGASAYHHNHGPAGHYAPGHGHHVGHGVSEKIKDTLDDIVEDAADGRIDGIKGRMGFPNSRHHYGAGGGMYPAHGYHHGVNSGRAGSFSRMLGKGLDKLNHKLQDSDVHGLNRYEFADALRELHELMAYNQHESPLMRCDRFSTLLSSSPMSHDQVRHIAKQPLAKLATGRPLAESRPVLQSMLQEYGNLFLSWVDGPSRALGDELLGCASMAIQSDYHNQQQQAYHQGGYPPAPIGGQPMYAGAGVGVGGTRLRNKFNSKLGMLPFEKQLNSRFPTMPAMPTMHY